MNESAVEDDGSADPRGFLTHIVVGMLIALPVFIGILFLGVSSTTDRDTTDVIGVAVWAGMWAALFLGGGLGVGMWLLRNEH